MTILDETYTLANGVRIPKIGFGTWQIPDGSTAYESVACALANGYRHIDTARAYGNEASVGRAVRASGIARNEVFVTSKLPAEIKTHAGALESFERTMAALALDYVDLYLIHAPWPWSKMGQDFTAGNQAVWKAMEMILRGGRCRAIGISNFSVRDMKAILDIAEQPPQVNQIRFFIGSTQDDVTRFCAENGILAEGYSPLATGSILNNEAIAAKAKDYNRTVAQLCIRYVLQKGLLPLPKSTHPDRIIENLAVDFEITPDDMAYLDGLKLKRR